MNEDPRRSLATGSDPSLVINGRQDGLFTVDGMEEAHRKLAASYQKAGVPTHFRAHLYDTPHQFNREMQAEAWEWLRKGLQPK